VERAVTITSLGFRLRRNALVVEVSTKGRDKGESMAVKKFLLKLGESKLQGREGKFVRLGPSFERWD
jgi:hypothetical protein